MPKVRAFTSGTSDLAWSNSPDTKSKNVGQECPFDFAQGGLLRLGSGQADHTDKGHAGGPDHPDVVRGLAPTDDLTADD